MVDVLVHKGPILCETRIIDCNATHPVLLEKTRMLVLHAPKQHIASVVVFEPSERTNSTTTAARVPALSVSPTAAPAVKQARE